MSKVIKSAVIRHSKYGYRVCNICQDAELYDDNDSGVCGPCTDFRVEDGVWTKEQAYSDTLRTDEDGCIINK